MLFAPQVSVLLAIKIFVLPFLQLGCAKLWGLSAPAGMSLVLLALMPPGATAFVFATQ